MDKIYKVLSEKLFKLDEIYVVYSKTTGCPYLFTGTYKDGENLITLPPNIRIYTKASPAFGPQFLTRISIEA